MAHLYQLEENRSHVISVDYQWSSPMEESTSNTQNQKPDAYCT